MEGMRDVKKLKCRGRLEMDDAFGCVREIKKTSSVEETNSATGQGLFSSVVVRVLTVILTSILLQQQQQQLPPQR